MNRGRISRTALFLMALILMLAVAAGCGGGSGDEVETDPATTVGEETTETVPAPMVPEETEPVVETPDYAAMEPADFGIEDVFFCFDCYDLDDEALAVLSRNARILRDTGVMILVSGHTDERGTVEYNLALGERRANAVKDYLVSLGVSASKIRTTSYGKSRPFAYGSNEDAWAQNRRVHFERP